MPTVDVTEIILNEVARFDEDYYHCECRGWCIGGGENTAMAIGILPGICMISQRSNPMADRKAV